MINSLLPSRVPQIYPRKAFHAIGFYLILPIDFSSISQRPSHQKYQFNLLRFRPLINYNRRRRQTKPIMINTLSNLANSLPGLNSLLRPLQGGSGFSKTNQLVPQIRDHAGRELGIGSFDSPKAAALLNDRLASAVGNALAANGPQSLAGQNGDFSPEKIAKNILSFINTALDSAQANGADSAALAQKKADAQAAVEKGFAEAKDILHSFGAWNGSIKENAEKTLELIRKGFDNPAASGTLPATPAQAASRVQSANFAAYEAKSAGTFEMEIKTREGDIVKLSYSAKQSSGFQASRSANDSGVTQTLSAYSSQSENLSFSVQGDLNDDEKKAIDNLMKDVDKLAQDFYGGNMQGAMQHAMALDMNKEQLSSMSLDLSYTQSHSAIAAYQQVGALDRGSRSHQPLRNAEIGTIANFNQSLTDMLREAERFFQDADQMVKNLFGDLAPGTANDQPQGSEKGTLRDLLNGLISAASSRNAQEKAAPAQPEI